MKKSKIKCVDFEKWGIPVKFHGCGCDSIVSEPPISGATFKPTANCI